MLFCRNHRQDVLGQLNKLTITIFYSDSIIILSAICRPCQQCFISHRQVPANRPDLSLLEPPALLHRHLFTCVCSFLGCLHHAYLVTFRYFALSFFEHEAGIELLRKCNPTDFKVQPVFFIADLVEEGP